MNAWKVATFVFGISLVVLATRLVQRENSRLRAPQDTLDRSSDQSRARPDHSKKRESRPIDIERSDRPEGSLGIEDLPSDPAEFVVSLLGLHWGAEVVRVDEDRAFELLNERKPDVTPVFENWMRRLPELRKAGVDVAAICRAYARVCGPDAVAPLESYVADERGKSDDTWIGHVAAFALASIDHPAAVDAIERLQSNTPKSEWAFGPLNMINQGSPAVRAMIRRWAQHGPPNDPELAWEVRHQLFENGDEDDRLAVLAMVNPNQRDRLILAIRPGWSADWQARLRQGAPRILRSEDRWHRLLACGVILTRNELFTQSLATEVERVLSSAQDAPDLSDSERSYIPQLLKLRREQKEKDARRAKARAALLDR
ncbi:MAG: hypothetical protein ACYTHK_02165 [Planctomycetota bacterium]